MGAYARKNTHKILLRGYKEMCKKHKYKLEAKNHEAIRRNIKVIEGYRKQGETRSLYEKIKAMSLEEMVSFLADLERKTIIATADKYICQKCKSEHGGRCPIGDDDECLYDMGNEETIKLWLESGI